MFEKLEDGIYRLCVPFEDIYTSVFLLVHENDSILADCATTETDVETLIIPALKELEIIPTYLLCSHMHDDHCGGLPTLRKYFPNAKVGIYSQNAENQSEDYYHFVDGELLLDRYRILNLRGHCDDSMGILDLYTKTLLTFDSLQQYGVSKYGIGVKNYRDYRNTIQKVRALSVNKIIASHDFVPLGYYAEGEKEINAFLEKCEEAINSVINFQSTNTETDCELVASFYNIEHPDMPPIYGYVIEGAREELWKK